MYDKTMLSEKLDEVLNGLNNAVGKKEHLKVNSGVVEFSRLISESPGILDEEDLTKYGKIFQQIMIHKISLKNKTIGRGQAKILIEKVLSRLEKSVQDKEPNEIVAEHKKEILRTLTNYKEILKSRDVRKYMFQCDNMMSEGGYLPK